MATVSSSVRFDEWLVMITAIGAVGPEICDRVPPNTAPKPTRDGAVEARGRASPDATPNASDTGTLSK